MTNLDRLISLLGFQPANDNSTLGTLEDGGINPADTYDPANSYLLKRMAISLMQLLLTTADTTNENQYAIKYDRNAVLARIKLLEAEIQDEDATPTINAVSAW